VTGFGVECCGDLERPAGLDEAAEFEQDLAFESPVDRHLATGLERAADQEKRTFEVVEVESRLGLQVVDLGLAGAVEPRKGRVAGKHLVAERGGLLELAQVLHQQLDAIQMGRDELRVGIERPLELVQGLVHAALVPKDLAASVVRLRTFRMRDQRLVEPRQRLIGAAAVRCLHCLIQAIPIAIDILHGLALEKRWGGAPARNSRPA